MKSRSMNCWPALFTLADTLFGWTAWPLQRIIAVEADEPPENRPAVDLCDNELLRAEGHDPSHNIGWWGRLAASL